MSFRNEMELMEKYLEELVTSTLANIREKSSGKDYVLDDENESFKKHFLKVANNRLMTAYDGYVIEASIKRVNDAQSESDDVIIVDNTIKKEIIDEEEVEEAAKEQPKKQQADQETTVSQSSIELEEIIRKIDADSSDKFNEKEATPSTVQDDSTHGQDLKKARRVTFNESATEPVCSSERIDNLLFYCVHCQDNDFDDVSYTSIEGVYKHWILTHNKLRAEKKFEFCVGKPCRCSICFHLDTFRGMKRHFREMHHEATFAIVDHLNVRKCAICDFEGANLHKHFEMKHKITTNANIFSALRLPESDYKALKAIKIHKKQRCSLCKETFDTDNQVRDHFYYKKIHGNANCAVEDVISEEPPDYICGICDETVPQNEMKRHILKHELKCTECNVSGKWDLLSSHYERHHPNKKYSIDDSMLELQKGYFATKIAYKNGLVLTYSHFIYPNIEENDYFFDKFGSLIDFTKIITEHKQQQQQQQPMKNRETFTIVNSSSSSINSINFGSIKDLSDAAKVDQLQKQSSKLSTLIVHGLPTSGNDEKMKIFLSLCRHLGKEIVESDISSIYTPYDSRELVVKFVNRVKKEEVIRAFQLKGKNRLKSDDFLKLSPGVQPEMVRILPQLTKFYESLTHHAINLIKCRKLFSQRISSNGLAVKRDATSTETYVKSCRELDDYVLYKFPPRNQQKRKNSMSSNSDTNTPKQLKF